MTVDVERSSNKTARYQNLMSWLTNINTHSTKYQCGKSICYCSHFGYV